MAYQEPTREPLTSGSLASKVGGRVIGRDDLVVEGIETLDRADARHVTFIRNASYANSWATSKAGVAFVSEHLLADGSIAGHDPATRALIAVADADLALNFALDFFAPKRRPAASGVHATAVVDPSAKLGQNVGIGPGAIISADCEIGDGASIGALCVLGRGVKVGMGTTLHPRVTIYDGCEIGRACTLHSGVVIGADGFGFRPDPSGKGLVKVPHIGNVQVHDGVEIGANSCIDRAKFSSTIIGAGTKIDNLVQIAHNCRVGRGCIICGGAMLAGSVELGDGVMIGGQVGIADQIKIGKLAQIGAQSGVMQNIEPGLRILGTPALPAKDTLRVWAITHRLPDTVRDLIRREKRTKAD